MKTSIEIKKELEQAKKEDQRRWKEWRIATKGISEKESYLHPLWKEWTKQLRIVEGLEREYQSALNYEAKVGDGITIHLYSDSHAYTIIKRTQKTITIQRDKATLKEDFKPEIIPGGFAGHCVNNYEQDYDYKRDEKGATKVLHWSEKNGNWKSKSGSVSLGRHEFYDYNF